MNELYKRFRPKSLKTVYGQDAAVAQIQKFIEDGDIPQFILLTGPSGVGKTTIARILRTVLKCGDQDFREIDAVDARGIDTVRELKSRIGLAPMSGECRIFHIDECHGLTGPAQQSLLRVLEDTPKNVYFILSTTDPQKLIPTILSRATEIKLNALSHDAIKSILNRVCEKDELKVSGEVIDEICEVAEGSGRKALVILNQVGKLSDPSKQMAAVKTASVDKQQVIMLCRALINPRTQWKDIAVILKGLEDDPEKIRYAVLYYFQAVLLNGANIRAFRVIDVFSSNFYDSKKPGLVAACFEVVCLSDK